MAPRTVHAEAVVVELKRLRRGVGATPERIQRLCPITLQIACVQAVAQSRSMSPASALLQLLNRLADEYASRQVKTGGLIGQDDLIRSAFALSGGQAKLGRRQYGVASRWNVHPDTVRKKENMAIEALAHQLIALHVPDSSLQMPIPEDAVEKEITLLLNQPLELVSFTMFHRIDSMGRTAEVTERRRVRSLAAPLEGYTYGLKAVEGAATKIERVVGARLEGETRQSLTGWRRFLLRFEPPLPLGQEHEFTVIRVARPEDRPQRPLLRAFARNPVSRAEISVSFSPLKPPRRVWRAISHATHVPELLNPYEELLPESGLTYSVEFDNCEPGKAYGLDWEW